MKGKVVVLAILMLSGMALAQSGQDSSAPAGNPPPTPITYNAAEVSPTTLIPATMPAGVEEPTIPTTVSAPPTTTLASPAMPDRVDEPTGPATVAPPTLPKNNYGPSTPTADRLSATPLTNNGPPTPVANTLPATPATDSWKRCGLCPAGIDW